MSTVQKEKYRNNHDDQTCKGSCWTMLVLNSNILPWSWFVNWSIKMFWVVMFVVDQRDGEGDSDLFYGLCINVQRYLI